MFSKMNSGQAPSNWRQIEGATISNGGRGSSNTGTASGKGDLNRSFRVTGEHDERDEEDEDDGYDQEIDEDNEGEEEDEDERN